jgi:hypothetical protein
MTKFGELTDTDVSVIQAALQYFHNQHYYDDNVEITKSLNGLINAIENEATIRFL